MVATPIGNARDITLRAMDVLASADVLAAEDTRTLRRLLELCGIPVGERPLIAYHDHNGARARPRLLDEIAAGRSVAYASEAGTPLISDPGFDLLRAVREAGLPATAAPGASAVVTALSVAGLPSDQFLFAGFLPNARGARARALEALADTPATLVFYESPKRLGAMLAAAADTLGADRQAAVCRELTKRFEECRRGTLAELCAHYTQNPARGEIVVLIEKGSAPRIDQATLEDQVRETLKTLSVRDTADRLSRELGVKRREVYQMAMSMSEND
ncbi:16S rRNA (cytidine(1402)-2'-O)-methyltransferase [Cognatishimia sp. F0-27]|uniref:16S rRNA (cytidine(1402)-2'-O)-methyltransferase n=1 Tax=Cognatishimia sp. F0-27 TaxID=2816855 RepID=UPI001D0CD7BD|nr:16S rRNA (cytidine(1402)-2'-O)-methyltransferase [Cognatishimia sp. F0-27]MCC1493958.1 16S rRNA (cytidine(1402)-2'-O)-methyltransferase [Cognatishimia sp. F0-27]